MRGNNENQPWRATLATAVDSKFNFSDPDPNFQKISDPDQIQGSVRPNFLVRRQKLNF